jgi:hypothetical protein
LDIDNKLNSYLKITGILNNVFRPEKNLKETRIKLYNTLALPVCCMAVKLGLLNQGTLAECQQQR